MKNEFVIPITYLDPCGERDTAKIVVKSVLQEYAGPLAVSKNAHLAFLWDDGVKRVIEMKESVIDLEDETRRLYFECVNLDLMTLDDVRKWLAENPPNDCGVWTVQQEDL